jgi:AcrR family transcriptional regulator
MVRGTRKPPTDGSKDRILDAAFAIMCEHGFAGTAISAVERRSGLPATSIYYHFGSKDGLGAAVVQREAGRWLNHLHDLEKQSTDLRTQVREHMQHVTQLLDERPEFLQLLILLTFEHSSGRADTLEVIRTIRLEARSFLLTVMREILAPMGDESERLAERVTRLTFALIEGLFVENQVNDTYRIGDFVDEVVVAVEAILGAYLQGAIPPANEGQGQPDTTGSLIAK